jgi:hypothetical protein
MVFLGLKSTVEKFTPPPFKIGVVDAAYFGNANITSEAFKHYLQLLLGVKRFLFFPRQPPFN